jgi:hypothetical protein
MPLHCNYEIRWKNFRALDDTDWLIIRPLTILIGPNNAGKTSIISPLLLMDQTMSSRDAVTPLVTRGPLLDAGPFQNIIHKHDVSKPLFLGFRWHTHSKDEGKGRIGKIGSHPPGGIEVTLVAGDQSEDILLKRFALFDSLKRPFLAQTRRRSGSYSLASSAFTVKRDTERRALTRTRPVNFLFSPSAAMRELQKPRRKKEVIKFVEPSRAFNEYFGALSFAFGELTDVFRGLSYVGPLRERPQRCYPVSGELPISVGSRGEHMANLVRVGKGAFRRQLDKWVQRFEFGTRVRVQRISDELFSLCFDGNSKATRTNIADAGFGASQVLPLIVQALAARPRTLTIAEQPEIHLNPRLQYLLADLFADMANSDHRVIVETHSEHLLLRLRRLVASGKITPDKVALYFVEKKKDGVSSVREIPIRENGSITSNTWPIGFFEDSLRESLALATAQSERAKQTTAKKGSKSGSRQNASR